MASDRDLSRRERQIINILHEKGEASAKEVLAEMPEAPTYSTVRALLKRMLDKEVISQRREGQRYIYTPVEARADASASALSRLLKTFFEGSAAKAVNALLGSQREPLSSDELAEIERAIEKAKQRQKHE